MRYFLTGGGLDSAAQILLLHKYNNSKLNLLYIDYGNKASVKEREAVEKFRGLPFTEKVEYLILSYGLKNLAEGGNPIFTGKLTTDREKFVVPGRNVFLIWSGLFYLINKYKIDDTLKLYVGFHKEPDKTFLDAQEEFIKLVNNMIDYLDINAVVEAPFIDRERDDIIIEAYHYGLEKFDFDIFEASWTCYYPLKCGVCPHCIQEKEIIKKILNGMLNER